MNIAFSIAATDNSNENFIHEIFNIVAKSHLEHTFLFISKEAFDLPGPHGNVIPVVARYETKNQMKWFIWYNFTIRKILKKYKADVFISEKVGSLITKAPQILITPDLSPLYGGYFVNKKQPFFYKKFMPRFLKKAKAIITFSQFEKANLIKKYKTDTDKIKVIYEGANKNLEPITIEEREIIKNKYAGGNEYFIYAGIISPQKNLMNLLKAFSAFKKRQQSSMQLILAGNPGKQFKEFERSLNLYKFRNEIGLLDRLEPKEAGKIIASSYSIFFPSLYEHSANRLLSALKYEVPVIASSTGLISEICSESALYFNPENYKDIAEKMMLIFKDEKLRKELIEKGKRQAQKYNWEKSARAFWQLLEKNSVSST